jgi:hypothetical protein
MNKPSKGNLSPEDRKVVKLIAEAAGEIMFDHYESLPIDYRMTLADVIKNAHRMLDDDVMPEFTPTLYKQQQRI